MSAYKPTGPDPYCNLWSPDVQPDAALVIEAPLLAAQSPEDGGTIQPKCGCDKQAVYNITYNFGFAVKLPAAKLLSIVCW